MKKYKLLNTSKDATVDDQNQVTMQPFNHVTPMKKRRSKIARLPRAIREELNARLDEGATYREIILWLAEKGYSGINENVLFHWRRGGYVDWCQAPDRRENAADLCHWAADLAAKGDPALLTRAVANYSAARLFGFLRRVQTGDITQSLASNPEHLGRYINAMLRAGKMSADAQKLAFRLPP
jgi:hypothetical protein